jgi:hypothetical protein
MVITSSVVIGGLGLLLNGVSFAVGRKAQRAKDAREKRSEQISLEGSPATDQVRREPSESRLYSFRAINVGKSPITHLTPALVDSSGSVCSERDADNVVTLLVGKSRTFILKVTEPGDQNPLFVEYTWFDQAHGLTQHKYRSKDSVP